MRNNKQKKLEISSIVMKTVFFLIAAIIILCFTAKDEKAIEIASKGEIATGKIVGVTKSYTRGIHGSYSDLGPSSIKYDCFYYVDGARYNTHFKTPGNLIMKEGLQVNVRYLPNKPGESMVFNEDNLPTFKDEIAKYRANHSLLRWMDCRMGGPENDLTRLRKIAAREIKRK